MIIVKLMGGLGNQMFQYAAARALSFTNKVKLKLDTSLLQQRSNSDTPREYELNVFKIEDEIAGKRDIESFTKWEDNYVYKQAVKTLPYITRKRILRERHFHFDKSLLSTKDNVLLIGYWQSEKYFSLIADIIRSDFQFAYEPSKQNKNYTDEITSTNSVSIHIRRGDYIHNPQTSKYHPVCSVKYYEEAVCIISKNISSPVFYIFSDDLEWAKENIKLNYRTEFISGNTGKKSYEDMRLMSLCKHHIIANSSFSWWGAWLNKNASKTVVAPDKWFNDPFINADDLIPSNWIRI